MKSNNLNPTIVAAVIHGLNQNDSDKLADEIILISRRLGIKEFSDLLTLDEIEESTEKDLKLRQKKAKNELQRHGIVLATCRERHSSIHKPWVFISVKGKQKLTKRLEELVALFGHDYIDDYQNDINFVYEIIK